MEDPQIIALYLRRDEAAIAQTQLTYGNKLHSLAYGILNSTQDAGECVNDTYFKAWTLIPPHQPTYLYAFLAKICRRLCFGRLDYQHALKRGGETVALTEELAACIPAKLSETELEESELGAALTEFLHTLPPDSRLLFLRRYWFCEAISQIARRYGCSESRVKTSLHRTRKKLKFYLEGKGFSL